MDAHVYPNERRFAEQIAPGERWQPIPLIEELKVKARAEELWNLFLPASVSDDFPLARAWAHARTLRLADGPDEVHLEAIARSELGRAQ